MPKLDRNQAIAAKADPIINPFFNNMLGSCGQLHSLTQRPFSDTEVKAVGLDLPSSPMARGTNMSAPTVILPQIFYEKLIDKFQKMPGQKGERNTMSSKLYFVLLPLHSSYFSPNNRK
jgi:hypothetical protein